MLGCNFPTDKMSYFKTDYCTSVGMTIHVECQGFLKERLENPDLKLTSTVCLFEANGAWNCNQHVETNKPIEFLSGKRSKLGNFTPATWKLHWQSKQTSWSWNCLDFFPIIMAEQNGSLQNKDTFLHKKRSCCTSIVGASKSISDFILKLKKSAERSKFMQTLDMHMQIYSLVGIYIYISTYSTWHIDLYPAVFSLQKRFHRHWDFPFHLTPYSGAGDPSKASVSGQPGAEQLLV